MRPAYTINISEALADHQRFCDQLPSLLWLAVQRGGMACIQHLMLRLLLKRAGCIPSHYVRFLNDCADRLLLLKVGGGYRFFHPLLQDYFASLHAESMSASRSKALET